MNAADIVCREVDLRSPSASEKTDIIRLLNAYARDKMGGAEPLSEYTQTHLVDELMKRSSYSHVYIAYRNDVVDENTKSTLAIGLVICFEGFSTFSSKGILNIHDVYVDPRFRGTGVASLLLESVERTATTLGFCKLTLEVLSRNTSAQQAYSKFGFNNYSLSEDTGIAEFWQKKLDY
jgi:GNAT superfamily N-acetyltransferase